MDDFLVQGRVKSRFVRDAVHRFSKSAVGITTFSIRASIRTLGSEMTPGVCTCTTFWTNLIQQTLIPWGAESHRLRMFCLIAVIVSHRPPSFGRSMLFKRKKNTSYQNLVYPSRWQLNLQGQLPPTKICQADTPSKPGVKGWGIHIHLPKDQWIQTCKSLNHAPHHHRIFSWHLEQLLQCL